ncbi:MAG: hypothetical protein KDD63_12990 [Bacteroidetes bacterium]|nr:hypothetical protein [Bacteroidota bacterium]
MQRQNPNLPFLVTLFFFAWVNAIYTQSPQENPTQKAFQHAAALYHQSMQKQALLYSGSEYIPQTNNLRGSPYYRDWVNENGSITFDSISFSDVLMRYNIVKDELIVERVNHYGYSELVQLNKAKVNAFRIQNDVFIHYPAERWENLKGGFYQPLYQGQVLLLKKIMKQQQQEFDKDKVTTYFKEKEQYFLAKSREAYLIKNKGSLLKLFPDEKKDMNKFAKTEGLRFKRNKEETIIKLLQWYEQR